MKIKLISALFVVFGAFVTLTVFLIYINTPLKVVGESRIFQYRSPYLGKSYKTTTTMLYQKNLPSENCNNRPCVITASYKLMRWQNQCGGCFGPGEITTKVRLEAIPPGTHLKVVESYLSDHISFLYRLFNSRRKYLVLQDKEGNKSEMSELEFELDVVNGDQYPEFDKKVEDILTSFKLKKEEAVWHCLSLQPLNEKFYGGEDERKTHLTLQMEEPFYYSPYIELKLLQFIRDFQLEREINVSHLSEINLSDGPHTCALITISSLDAYLLSEYYFQEWNLYTDSYRELGESFCRVDNRGCVVNSDKRKFDIRTIESLSFKDAFEYIRK